MAYATAAGTPSYSGTFVPEVWSGKLVVRFYNATVFGEISNTDYEGAIKNQGDTVNIRQLPDINIYAHSQGQDLNVQRPEKAKIQLVIDQGFYFNFAVDDVFKMQADIKVMTEWADTASEQLKEVVDSTVLNGIYADVDADNSGGTAGKRTSSYNLGASGAPVALDNTNVLEHIINLEMVLSEQNVPQTGRWYVIPTWMAGLIQLSDLKDASLSGDSESIVRNGRLGRIGKFILYESNAYTSVVDGSGATAWHTVAGHKSGLTFASQMVKMQTLTSEHSFDQLVRGLTVFGYKVIKGVSLAEGYVSKA